MLPRTLEIALRDLAIVGAIMASAGAVSVASAQLPAISFPLPAHPSHPVTLASGVIIRQDEPIISPGRNESSVTITIETPTRAADSTRVAHEASEVAASFREHGRVIGIDHIAVAVCRTQACLELHERPKQWFTFSRAKDGSWSRVRP